jgi:hypothetical protein
VLFQLCASPALCLPGYSLLCGPLQEVDVNGELTAARASIDKLAKQLALLSRDQEVRGSTSITPAAPDYDWLHGPWLCTALRSTKYDAFIPLQEGRIQAEKRLQQVETRQAEVERQLAALVASADATAAESAGAVEELRQATKGMLSEVIGRIADQFDALQAALEEAIGSRAAEAEDRAAAAEAVQHSLDAQREWLQHRVDSLQQQLEERLEAGSTASAAAMEQQQQRVQEQLGAVQAAVQRDSAELRAGLEASRQQLDEAQQRQEEQAEHIDNHAAQLVAATEARQQAAAALEQSSSEAARQAAEASAAVQQQLSALADEQAAAASRQTGAEGLLRQALNVWQRGVEDQFAGLEARLAQKVTAAADAQEQLAARFEEYKGYVKRLRRQLAGVQTEQGEPGVQFDVPQQYAGVQLRVSSRRQSVWAAQHASRSMACFCLSCFTAGAVLPASACLQTGGLSHAALPPLVRPCRRQ